MADQTTRTNESGSLTANPADTASRTPPGAARAVGEQVASAGRELKDKAADLAGKSTDQIKNQAGDFVESAKEVASQATDKLKQTVDDKKGVGADYVNNLAETIRRAAREFEGELPIAATYIRKAASQLDGVSDSIRSGNLSDVTRSAQDFARRQPAMFLGLATLAGFGVVRFLKSSSNKAAAGESRLNRDGSANRGHRDEFAS